jgi:REP element-mobilizing transposase RayT
MARSRASPRWPGSPIQQPTRELLPKFGQPRIRHLHQKKGICIRSETDSLGVRSTLYTDGMARPLRIEFLGAVYHVTARRHERSAMFRDDTDRQKFLGLLGGIVRDNGWELHAYCLMDNRYHLLVGTPIGGLSLGMKSLNGRYAQWFNRRHRRRGHFLEGRFRSVFIQKGSHLLEVHRYIVLNPVRARIVRRAGDWKWSSYRATAGLADSPAWLTVDGTLGQFARSRSAARRAFRRFVAEGKGSGREVEQLERAGFVGDEEFAKRLEDALQVKAISDEVSTRYRRVGEVTLEQVRRAVAREWGVAEASLARPRGGIDKMAAIYLARKLMRLGGREIGRAFGVKPARVSNVVTAIEREASSPVARRIEKLRLALARQRG